MSVRDHDIDSGGWCRTDRCSAHVCMRHEAETAEALCARQREALDKTIGALENMQEFYDCIEAQRKDEPMPEGHEEESSGCGDGTCFVVGEMITGGLEAAKQARADIASVPARPRRSGRSRF